MIARQAEMQRPEPRRAAVVESAPSAPATRRFDVAIHRTKNSRCDTGELTMDRAGVHARGCRPTDYDLFWTEVSSVCYSYGSRGVAAEFKTSKRSYRVSTDTPAQAKKIVTTVAQMRPAVRRNEGCP